ncbi:hypothetical protein [Paracoccus saliphilus]|uniref:Uncharacterized protein n=1 Tax=Paracoccus saliphilus TaxID=405559 RepID=A0AA45W8S0_9RHOB|nr:hypothetical protein [Paracoccus saliphilus]WCR05549.1 hypothetical protein JHX88_22090 [Paracoccus saliphilus]SIT18718.1 hypothetical protein SAMN05421772_1411 [Paracoccus saliphilus]
MSDQEEEYPNDMEERLNELEAAVHDAKTAAIAARNLAVGWSTECDSMLTRIGALERALAKAGIVVSD